MMFEINNGDMISIRDKKGNKQVHYVVSIEGGYGGRDYVKGTQVDTGKEVEILFLRNALQKPNEEPPKNITLENIYDDESPDYIKMSTKED